MVQPEFDEGLVQRLADIADHLDGGDEVADAPLLEEFNKLAGADVPFSEFQGLYGAEDHVDYVRRLLTRTATDASPDLGREGLVEMFARVLADPGDDAYLEYVFTTVEKTFGDDQVSDLVFWPGEYFGDGNDQRELTPETMADAVLARHAQRKSR
ncbi:MAG: hypothetical protein CMJ49_13735 [Planctomycetaceae bacterium]|nr:hypothetical protein [Planctomycetaceae bacterium]